MSKGKRYPSEHEGAHTAPGRCIQLLEQSSPRRDGIVLDLGCGNAPLAEQVRDLGLEYVGADVDPSAVAEVAERGFETHRLDLGLEGEDLRNKLAGIVRDRHLSAVLLVDVLEHLVAPDAILGAARHVAPDGDGCSLIVSVPNVTHVDIAAKLLLGRWDLTEFGLLDDTHLRFFSERLFNDLFEATGWREADALDVISPLSDQLFPIDAPLLRPGAPAREVLHDLSSKAHPHSSTYQFVRRFTPGEIAEGGHSWRVPRESDEERIFASVLVRSPGPGSDEHQRLLDALERQSSEDFETIVLGEGEDWNAGIASATGRYLCFLDPSAHVSTAWIQAFKESHELAGHVLHAEAVAVPSAQLDGSAGKDVFDGPRVRLNPLDLLQHESPGPTVLPAYAVPIEAARTSGVRFDEGYGRSAPAVFLTRAAELCGVVPVEAATVAVSSDIAFDVAADQEAVLDSLDSAPLILPPGSARRIFELRKGFEQSASWRLTRPLRAMKRAASRQRSGR